MSLEGRPMASAVVDHVMIGLSLLAVSLWPFSGYAGMLRYPGWRSSRLRPRRRGCASRCASPWLSAGFGLAGQLVLPVVDRLLCPLPPIGLSEAALRPLRRGGGRAPRQPRTAAVHGDRRRGQPRLAAGDGDQAGALNAWISRGFQLMTWTLHELCGVSQTSISRPVWDLRQLTEMASPARASTPRLPLVASTPGETGAQPQVARRDSDEV